jgi:hypothetical protein
LDVPSLIATLSGHPAQQLSQMKQLLQDSLLHVFARDAPI